MTGPLTRPPPRRVNRRGGAATHRLKVGLSPAERLVVQREAAAIEKSESRFISEAAVAAAEDARVMREKGLLRPPGWIEEDVLLELALVAASQGLPVGNLIEHLVYDFLARQKKAA